MPRAKKQQKQKAAYEMLQELAELDFIPQDLRMQMLLTPRARVYKMSDTEKREIKRFWELFCSSPPQP